MVGFFQNQAQTENDEYIHCFKKNKLIKKTNPAKY